MRIVDADAATVALEGLRTRSCAVLLKGGHLDEGATVIDRYDDGIVDAGFEHDRLDIEGHGTGLHAGIGDRGQPVPRLPMPRPSKPRQTISKPHCRPDIGPGVAMLRARPFREAAPALSIEAQEIDAETGDGHRYRLLARIPADAHRSLLWLPALGIAAKHYLPLAEALAARGVAAFVHEWRGNGSSVARGSRPRLGVSRTAAAGHPRQRATR